MNLTERVLRVLITDPRSRRALDETLLDVRSERPPALSFGRAWWVLRSAGAIGRVMAMTAATETAHFGAAAIGLRILVVIVVPTSLLVLTQLLQTDYPASSPTMQGTLFVALLPQAVAGWMPAAAWLLAIWTRGGRTLPIVPLVLTLAILEIGMVGWIAPDANQHFRVTVFDSHKAVTPDFYSGTLSRGVAERTLPELLSRWPDSPPVERRHLQARLVLCGFVAALAVLGGVIARTLRPRRAPWTAGVIVVAWVFSGSGTTGGWLALAATTALAMVLLLRLANQEDATHGRRRLGGSEAR